MSYAIGHLAVHDRIAKFEHILSLFSVHFARLLSVPDSNLNRVSWPNVPASVTRWKAYYSLTRDGHLRNWCLLDISSELYNHNAVISWLEIWNLV